MPPAPPENNLPPDWGNFLAAQYHQWHLQQQAPRMELRKISDFTGKETATEAEDWIDQIEALFRIRVVTSNTTKIETALSYFVKDAAQFARKIRAQRDKYVDWYANDRNNARTRPVACITWQEFRMQFMHHYVDVDPVETARDKLAALRMNKDQRADEFLTDFKNLADRTGYDDVALVRMLQQSLVMVPSLLEKILQLRKRPEDQEEQGSYRPETLEEWYTTVGDFDRAWRQVHARTQQVKKEKEGTSSSSSRPSNNNQARRQDYRPPPGPPPGYRPPGPPPPPRGPAGSFAPRPRRPNQWANQGQLNTSRPTNGNQWPRTTRDATGITYGGMGQPMDLSRVDTRDMRDVECESFVAFSLPLVLNMLLPSRTLQPSNRRDVFECCVSTHLPSAPL